MVILPVPQTISSIGVKSTLNQRGSIYGYIIHNGKIEFNDHKRREDWYDFIITQEGELRIGRGHYFLSDKAMFVKGAGEVYVNEDGKIDCITNNSGHYRPDEAQLKNQYFILKGAGLLSTECDIVDVMK